jgi:transposase
VRGPAGHAGREADRPGGPGAGVNEGTLGNWCAKARGAAAARRTGEWSKSEWAERARLRKEIVELRMQRDVLKRLVALWMDEAMGR